MTEAHPDALSRLAGPFGAPRCPQPGDEPDHGGVHRAVAATDYLTTRPVGRVAPSKFYAAVGWHVQHQHPLGSAALAASGGTPETDRGPAPSEQQGEWK
jgi:hypothetical protein